MKKTSGLLLALACAAASTWLSAYVVTPGRTRWEAGRVVLQVHFEDAAEAAVAQAAVEAWQAPLAGTLDLEATAPQGEPRLGNWRNDVAWADDLPPEVTSLTRIVMLSGRIVEADVSVARDHRGSAPSLDQVLLHEMGHVVGLGHADDGGQIVRGAMASDPDRMTPRPSSDDEAGLVALYFANDAGTSVTPNWRTQAVVFPPRNEPFAFRTQLETVYRDELRRPAQTSFVDIEGSIVWTQEYLRYRVNGCDHPTALLRVGQQILGGGIQPVCSEFTGTQVQFPPRNEPFAFRNDLERLYRDVLGRAAQQTFVDVEGDIVWTQEYLRYRVNACSHSQAVDRVLIQVRGGPVPPVCSVTEPEVNALLSGVTSGTTSATLVVGSRPPAGPGPVVNVLQAIRALNGGAFQTTLTTSQPADTVAVSATTPGTGSSIARPSAVASSYYLLRLPSRQTTIPLTISLPTQVAASNFTIDYAVSDGGAVFGSYRSQTVDVVTVGTGDVQVSVSWNTSADVDLHVIEPSGEEIYYGNDRSATGGELDLDSNADCSGQDVRLENIRWPTGRAPSGLYTVRVDYWSSCGNSSTAYVVRVINGSSSQTFTGTFSGSGTQGGAGSGTTVTTFSR